MVFPTKSPYHRQHAGTFYEQNYTTLLQQVTHSVPRIEGVNISKFFYIKYQQWKKSLLKDEMYVHTS